jgi:hypothetical protein
VVTTTANAWVPGAENPDCRGEPAPTSTSGESETAEPAQPFFPVMACRAEG